MGTVIALSGCHALIPSQMEESTDKREERVKNRRETPT